MDGKTDHEHRYECVQPDLGEQLWKLDTDDVDPELRLGLERHLRVCDDCRLQRVVHERLGELGAAGEIAIEVEPEEPKRLWSYRTDRFLAACGGLAVAASLALAMLIPPTLPGLPGTSRSDVPKPAFLRPVEGEVVAHDSPLLSWRAIGGATAYRLEITQIDGEYAWQGRSSTTNLRIPEEASLPARGHFRVILEPVPSDLSPLGGVSVAFRRAHTASVLIYRAGVAPPLVRLLGGIGVVSLLSAVFLIIRRRRAKATSR